MKKIILLTLALSSILFGDDLWRVDGSNHIFPTNAGNQVLIGGADPDGVSTFVVKNSFSIFGNNYFTNFAVSNQSANLFYLLPPSQVSGVLKNDGVGNLTWGAAGSASPLTTKGDLWGYSSLDARIPVGSNGQVLTADSSQTLGVKWAASSGGISSINSDSNSTHTLVATSTGTDFTISDPGSGVHNFNLPTASASNRGLLSTANWSTFNAKQPAGNYAIYPGASTANGIASWSGTGGTTLLSTPVTVDSSGNVAAVKTITANASTSQFMNITQDALSSGASILLTQTYTGSNTVYGIDIQGSASAGISGMHSYGVRANPNVTCGSGNTNCTQAGFYSNLNGDIQNSASFWDGAGTFGLWATPHGNTGGLDAGVYLDAYSGKYNYGVNAMGHNFGGAVSGNRMIGGAFRTTTYNSAQSNGLFVVAQASIADQTFYNLLPNAQALVLLNNLDSGMDLINAESASSSVFKVSNTGQINSSSLSASTIIGSDSSKNIVTGALTGDVTSSAFATTVAKIQSTTVSGTTGSTNVVFSASPTLTGTAVVSAVKSGNAHLEPSITAVGNCGSSQTLDLSTAQTFTITLNAASCALTFSNPQAGASYVLQLLQDGTGSRAVTTVSTVNFPGQTSTFPTLSGASRTDFVKIYYDGSAYWGSYLLNF